MTNQSENPELQAAFDALCAEIVKAQSRKDYRVKHVQKCFCTACNDLINTLSKPPEPLQSFGV